MTQGFVSSRIEPISNNETPENEFPEVCFCLFSLFTEIEQKNFISLLSYFTIAGTAASPSTVT